MILFYNYKIVYLEMKEEINIIFIGFWPTFNISDNIFLNVLKTKYDVKVLTEVYENTKIDLLLYSCFYSDEEYNFIKSVNCKKLYYSGENDFPNFNVCDYAMTQNRFEFDNRHFYLPYWFMSQLHYENDTLYVDIDTNGIDDRNLLNREFCSFVVSNNFCSMHIRTKIFNEISKYKQVASGGKYLNNVGGQVKDKKEFLQKYKFNIASENSIVNGYITEKLVDAFNAHTVPIYAGPNDVINEFNPASFINLNDFASFEDLLIYIERVDTDDELYMNMLKAPKIKDGVIESLQKQFIDFLFFAVEDKRKFNHKYGRIGLLNG